MNGRFDPGELAGPANPWRTTLLLSLGLHVLGFVLIVGVPRLVPRPSLPPVYLVDLVALPGGPANASEPPPAAAGAPAKAAAPAAPKEEKAVKIPERQKTPEKKKPEPKKPEPKKTPEPKKPEPKNTPVKPQPESTGADSSSSEETKNEGAPQPQGTPSRGASMSGVAGGTGAPGGGYGGTGAVQTDAMTFYASLVQRNIENAWKKPIYPPSETGSRAFTTQLRLVLTSSGRVSSASVVAPSGYDAMDRSVLDAVHDAMFPPFPSSLSYASLPFTIEIVLTRD